MTYVNFKNHSDDSLSLSIDNGDGEIELKGLAFFPLQEDRVAIALAMLGPVAKDPAHFYSPEEIASQGRSDEFLKYDAFRALAALDIRAKRKAAVSEASAGRLKAATDALVLAGTKGGWSNQTMTGIASDLIGAGFEIKKVASV